MRTLVETGGLTGERGAYRRARPVEALQIRVPPAKRPRLAAPEWPPRPGGASHAGRRAGQAGVREQVRRLPSAHRARATGRVPPLKDSAVVTAADPTEHIHILLRGMSGKAIGGVTYSAMRHSPTN